jgi:hypothetical protein
MRKLVGRIKALLLTPRTEWLVIERERTAASDLFIKYAAILAAIPEVAHLIGQTVIDEARAPFLVALLRALVSYAVSLAAVYLIACAIDFVAPRFAGKRNFSNALKLSVYSYTPLWLAGIFLLVPGLNFLVVLGFYGFYLLWLGLPHLMQAPNGEVLRYAALIAVCALIPLLVLAMV